MRSQHGEPDGPLTKAQLEILDLAWRAGEAGATVNEVWTALAARRTLARTTVLTMVTRLERRGWLVKVRRKAADRATRYRATADAAEAARRIARDFTAEFFGGSATELVRSLLGGEQVTRESIDSLRSLLDQVERDHAQEDSAP